MQGERENSYLDIFTITLDATSPLSRLWISSLTDKSIREGLQNLKAGSLYDNLFLSAQARSEADYLIGYPR